QRARAWADPSRGLAGGSRGPLMYRSFRIEARPSDAAAFPSRPSRGDPRAHPRGRDRPHRGARLRGHQHRGPVPAGRRRAHRDLLALRLEGRARGAGRRAGRLRLDRGDPEGGVPRGRAVRAARALPREPARPGRRAGAAAAPAARGGARARRRRRGGARRPAHAHRPRARGDRAGRRGLDRRAAGRRRADRAHGARLSQPRGLRPARRARAGRPRLRGPAHRDPARDRRASERVDRGPTRAHRRRGPMSVSLPSPAELPDELRAEALRAPAPEDRAAAYRALLAHLSRQSVAKHYDAYEDVPWDDPAYAIDPADPRFELPATDPLGATAWYRALPQPLRARFGLELLASFARVGLQFENVLQRGLLEFAFRLPNGAPEYRYVMHEVIEEGQHSLMFQEFVNRTAAATGFDVPGLDPWMQFGARQVVRLARTFPELFFLFVLGGEDPIDHIQRESLRTGQYGHPLVRRISQIHVTEEARHLSFARAYLRCHVPALQRRSLFLLRVRAP